MKLSPHELYDLNELTMSCVNSITNMGLFMDMAQDPELKTMLKNHFPAHIQDYNIKVEYLKNANGSTQKLNVTQMNKTYQNANAQTIPVTPRTNLQSLNDREIATAYLLTLKRAGREYAWAAMEISHPQIREFLKDAFTMSCNHAYEVWQWMAKKGYYPQETPSESSQSIIGTMYNEVKEPALV